MENGKVRFRYTFDNNFNTAPADGVFGGFTPHGDIIMNFFFERKAVPEFEEYTASEEGKLTGLASIGLGENPASYERVLTAGVVMGTDTAAVIRDWLDALIANKKEGEKDDE